MLRAEIRDENGKLLGVVFLSKRQFKTGSHGYYGSAKALGEQKSDRLQINVTAVVIGSKPVAEQPA